MLNTQKPSKRITDHHNLLLHSEFHTIQGEGPFAGRAALFIRLAGCNLQCPMCDTEYTEGATLVELSEYSAEVSKRLKALRCNLIVITGGEPFRQGTALSIFCNMMLHINHNLTIQIESNGTMAVPEDLNPNVVIVCSPKAHKVHPSIVERVKHWKYVLDYRSQDLLDGLPIKALDHPATPYVARPPKRDDITVYLQPADTQDVTHNERNVRLVTSTCLEFGYTLQLQIHKLIGVE